MATLHDVLTAAAGGSFPPADGAVAVVEPDPWGVEAVVALTGHAVVATALPADEVLAAGADGFGGATLPPVLELLRGPAGELDVLDALTTVRGTGSGAPGLAEVDPAAHPRSAHAQRWRADVRAYADGRGLVVLARGIGGLWQLSYEVPPELRGRGHGRALLRDGLGLVAAGEPVLVAVAPGNAASLRAILAVGAVPIGSVQLVRPGR